MNLQGRLKSNKKLASELSFDFCIESVGKLQGRLHLCVETAVNVNLLIMTISSCSVCLQDSVLAFWKHGMQGKSFKSNEVKCPDNRTVVEKSVLISAFCIQQRSQ